MQIQPNGSKHRYLKKRFPWLISGFFKPQKKGSKYCPDFQLLTDSLEHLEQSSDNSEYENAENQLRWTTSLSDL